jgi:hypothetical protein
MGLVQFLDGRAKDTNARKQISKDAFINLAQSLNIDVNQDNIQDIVGQPPLSSLLEPLTPDSTEITFKGGAQPQPPTMPVNKAQDIVAKAAKSAMNRDRGV